MLIVLLLYAALIWLIFVKLRVLPLNGFTKTLIALGGVGICLVVLALLNARTPSGRVALLSPTVDVTSEVNGIIEGIHFTRYAPVSTGDILLTLDKTPFQLAVDQARAAYELADKNYRRRSEMLENQSAAVSQRDFDQAKSRLDQSAAALKLAEFNLTRTEIRAAADGFLTTSGLDVGDAVVAFTPLMPLIKHSQSELVGAFDQSGRAAIQPGTEVGIAFRSRPGWVFWTTIAEVIPATVSGSIPTGGKLAGSADLGDDSVLFAVLNWPDALDLSEFETGSIGQVTVISESAGPVAPVARILLFFKSYRQYF